MIILSDMVLTENENYCILLIELFNRFFIVFNCLTDTRPKKVLLLAIACICNKKSERKEK